MQCLTELDCMFLQQLRPGSMPYQNNLYMQVRLEKDACRLLMVAAVPETSLETPKFRTLMKLMHRVLLPQSFSGMPTSQGYHPPQ